MPHAITTVKQYQEVIQKAKDLVVLKASASWCGPCRAMEPLVKSVSEKHKDVLFLSLDIDDGKELADKLNISAVPTLLFIKGGQIKHTQQGATQKLEELVVKYK
jgi:thioredoxin 1